MWDFSIQADHEAQGPDLVVELVTSLILQFLEIVRLRRRKKRKYKKSRSKKGVTEDLERESEDYAISCRPFRCDT